VADAARELAPACEQACGFFFRGLADFITAPIEESAASLTAHVTRHGAHILTGHAPELTARYDDLSRSIARKSLAIDFDIPPSLTVKPPVITAASLALQEDVLSAMTVESVHAVDLTSLVHRFEAERRSTQQVFDCASLVAGQDDESARHATTSFTTFILSVNAEERHELRAHILLGAAVAHEQIVEQTAQTWNAVALGAAKIALQQTGLIPESADLNNGRITARDSEDPSRRMEVHVVPQTGEVRYELFGYKGGQCQPIERQFLERYSHLLGAELNPQNVSHWETNPACAVPSDRVNRSRLGRHFTDERRSGQAWRDKSNGQKS
jgi:hypothetical protein